MELKNALDQHLLRVVAIQRNGYPKKYKGEDRLDYHQVLNQKVALVNESKQFMIVKDPVIATMTIASNSDKALIHAPQHASNVSAFLTVTLTKALLSQPILEYDKVKTHFEPLNLVDLLTKALEKPKELTEKELVNLALNADSLQVLQKTDFAKLTADAFLLEVFLQSTPRVRLASLEASKFGKVEKCLSLFKPREQKLLKLAEPMVG